MIIPSDVTCTYCKRIFCCSKCRFIHQEKMHVNETEDQNTAPKIFKDCHICKGQQFPLKSELSNDVFQHIVENHLPLKCNKCLKIFSSSDDFQDFGKCSNEKTECNLVESGTSEGQEKLLKIPMKVCDEKVSSSGTSKTDESSLTPLTKINLRWRRKSKGFEPSAVLDSASVSEQDEPKSIPVKPLSRQTSTPMPKCLSIASSDPSYNASSIQISSINCTSSTSSESDSCASPPVQAAPPKKVVNTPMIKIPGPAPPRSRPRMPVQATPLRQVMSKSIQRALAQHGFNKPINYNGLQQRKVCFDSTGSSNESSNSTCSGYPLDLRTSPVIRRTQSDSSSLLVYKKAFEAKKSEIKAQSELNSMEPSQAAQEESANSQKSTSETMSSHYYSCQSLVPSKSENLIEETPKNIPNPVLLKKTISFELTPNKQENTLFETACGDDDVFYTPCATPTRSFSCSAIEFKKNQLQVQATPCTSKLLKENVEKPGKSSDIWSLVTSVMRVAAKKPDKSLKEEEKQQENHKKSFNFSKVGLVQKAASFAGFLRSFRHDESSSTSSDPPSAKRRRLVTSELNITSPLKKKQRIQGRKPIDRMRNAS